MVADVISLLDAREVADLEVKLDEGGPPLQPPKSPKKPLTPKMARRVAREYFVVEQRKDGRGHRERPNR